MIISQQKESSIFSHFLCRNFNQTSLCVTLNFYVHDLPRFVPFFLAADAQKIQNPFKSGGNTFDCD